MAQKKPRKEEGRKLNSSFWVLPELDHKIMPSHSAYIEKVCNKTPFWGCIKEERTLKVNVSP
jgi:hypothetical protein